MFKSQFVTTLPRFTDIVKVTSTDLCPDFILYSGVDCGIFAG